MICNPSNGVHTPTPIEPLQDPRPKSPHHDQTTSNLMTSFPNSRMNTDANSQWDSAKQRQNVRLQRHLDLVIPTVPPWVFRKNGLHTPLTTETIRHFVVTPVNLNHILQAKSSSIRHTILLPPHPIHARLKTSPPVRFDSTPPS